MICIIYEFHNNEKEIKNIFMKGALGLIWLKSLLQEVESEVRGLRLIYVEVTAEATGRSQLEMSVQSATPLKVTEE